VVVLRENDDERSAESTFVREVVQRAEAKLAQLQARKKHIHSRMQALRYLVTHAEANYGRAAESPVVHTDAVQENASTPVERYRLQRQSRLRRACRIALMETDQPQSCAEIYERIQKRGSMSFDLNDNALQILSVQLKAMATNSEVVCSVANGETRWQWKRE